MGQVANDKFLFKPAAPLVLALKLCQGFNYLQLFCCFSSVAWQLALNPLENQKETGENEGHLVDRNRDGGDLCILIFRSLISSDKAVGLNFLQLLTVCSMNEIAFFFFTKCLISCTNKYRKLSL